ncbi:MAG TPA: hypothetical protein VNX86_06285 [Rhizomicrobium sp.]|jgi:hypothetical protein|nr:hypothetical protein [Rhizomicrobium sp.]
MLGKDEMWYLENADKIPAFFKYVKLVETDLLPRNIGRIVGGAVREAIDGVESDDPLSIDTDGPTHYWWFLPEGFNPDTDIGSWIEYWAPEDSVGWMTSGEGERPRCGIYTYGGKGPKGVAKTRKLGELASKSLQLPKGAKRQNKFVDDGYYMVAERYFDDVLTREACGDTKLLTRGLVELFRAVTIAFLPGLKAVRSNIGSRA